MRDEEHNEQCDEKRGFECHADLEERPREGSKDVCTNNTNL